MKKRIKGRLFLALAGIVFCVLPVCGCSLGEAMNTEEIVENEEYANTEHIDRYDLELAYNAYEKDYSAEIEVENERIPLEIWSSNIGYQVIIIDGQEIPYEHRDLPLGGAGLETMAYDFTNDGKEEIVFLESSGASGAYQYIFICCNTDGQWKELEISSDVYSDMKDSEFMKKQLEDW